MESYIKKFEHLKISYEVIKSATNNFDKANFLGRGSFGNVYRGELSHFKGHSMVAIKRLNRNSKFAQGDSEFWIEFAVLYYHKHEKLICLLGFCIESDEMILVYEYASNGSLDRHLSSNVLTWRLRLKICLDVARGLSYLHDAKGTKKTIIHRDIKSSNVLLNAYFKAKVSDLGLSMIVHAKQQQTGLFINVAGTRGYIDPSYVKTSFLMKESDIYSFGVLLLEVLCGRLCFENSNDQHHTFVAMCKKRYEENTLQEIIFGDEGQKDQNSLKTYLDITFKCLQKSREERPTMPHVVEKLETALLYQELNEGAKLPNDYINMFLTDADPLNGTLKSIHHESESELKMLLFKGILINMGNTLFSRNMDGDHCETISIAACLTSTTNESQHYISSPEYYSRFAVGCYEPSGANFKTHIRTQFLSPHTTYFVNLVYKMKNKKQDIVIEYKLEGEKRTSYSFLSSEREDGWLTAKLCQFTSDQRSVDLEIMFYTKYCPNLLVEGIEFQPEKNVHMQPISDKDTYWKQKLPHDYEDIIKWSKDSLRWGTMKDLYSIFCRGFLINDGEEWFSLDKDGKKCLMLSARAALQEDKWNWMSLAETRFEEVADYCNLPKFDIICKFKSKVLSPQTMYGTYLIYKLPEGYKNVKPPPVQVVDKDSHPKEVYDVFLHIPQTPVISYNAKNKAIDRSNTLTMKGLPKRRRDGWMEVQVHEFQTRPTIKMISTRLGLSSYNMGLKGLTVRCLEFRPI
ncbi:hypothetical protein SSX86_030226 [Deinandra increscens subsp. villosa]|uniref:Protein kinase domain-containing protein n=1 Tax=Deinandra increscens subsp. villosa TaxID=3103831 RepID=A0AAP0C638_9ASTR